MRTKIFYHLDGSEHEAISSTCRGCWMNENEYKLPLEVKPIWEDEDIIVRQDIEWPIPGFYIVSLRKHIETISDLDDSTTAKLFLIIKEVRRLMKNILGVEKAQLYHEEKMFNAHVHFWLLPLYAKVMNKHNIFPKVYDGNIQEYLKLFSYSQTKDKIMKSNILMRNAMKKI